MISKWLPQERLEKWTHILWGLVLVCLPVTSFRYYPPLFGRTIVQPLALYPLGLLFPLTIYVHWRKRELQLPRQIIPLAAFILCAIISTVIGGLFAPVPFRNAEFCGRALRAWVSLVFGLSFFITAFLMSRSQRDLTPTIKWLYLGFAASIIWGSIQAIAINTPLLPNSLIKEIQTLFSLRPTVKRRISGFAYEPAWLADQIVILYFPWLFATLLTGIRHYKNKWLETTLGVGGIVLLFLTYSRSGIFSAIIVITLVFFITGRRVWGRLMDWFLQSFRRGSRGAKVRRLLIICALLVALIVISFWLSRFQYFANLWSASMEEGLVNYIIENNAGTRLANNVAGFHVFGISPWSGIGLGGSELYLVHHYPDWALSELPELSRLLSPDSKSIPNIKNLYLLLLAETGLPGFWLFIAFYLSILGGILPLLSNRDQSLRYIGIAGLFIWLAAGLRNMTQDSLTFPVMWVSLGIVVGYTSLLDQ